jgi:hypothetical protein
MARTLGRGKIGIMAFALQFIGSLAYLWIVFGNGSALLSAAGLWALWVPPFIGIATVASITLFFTSFANLADMPLGAIVGVPVNAIAGVTLIALTAVSATPAGAGFGTTLYYTAIFGFVAALLGGISARISFMRRPRRGRPPGS